LLSAPSDIPYVPGLMLLVSFEKPSLYRTKPVPGGAEVSNVANWLAGFLDMNGQGRI